MGRVDLAQLDLYRIVRVATTIQCKEIEKAAVTLVLLLVDDRNVSESKAGRVRCEPVLEPTLVVAERA